MSLDNSDLPEVPPSVLAVPEDVATWRVKLDLHSPSSIWDPEPGDKIMGELSRELIKTKYGNKNLIVIAGEEGVDKIYPTKWLEILLEQNDVEVGDLIAIKFIGNITKGDRNMKAYNLIKVN